MKTIVKMFLVICEFTHEQLTQSKFQNNKSHPQMQASNASAHYDKKNNSLQN